MGNILGFYISDIAIFPRILHKLNLNILFQNAFYLLGTQNLWPCFVLFCSSHFSFLVFGHFWQGNYESTKILSNLRLHFARQDGQNGKKPGKKVMQLK